MGNINSREYWEERFLSGSWDRSVGPNQSRWFAESLIKHAKIEAGFDGTILDFGCAQGGSILVYRRAFPNATLIGMDISSNAIDRCKNDIGDLATFIQGGYIDIPECDIIISSNVFEHITDDKAVARHFLTKCSLLLVLVPYKEKPLSQSEHVNSYDEGYYREIGNYECSVFKTPGWSRYGWKKWYGVYTKNIARFLLKKPLASQKKQILFRFHGAIINR